MGATDGVTINEVIKVSHSDRPLSEVVSRFASIMNYKFNKNINKKGNSWKNTSYEELYNRLIEEVDELGRALGAEELSVVNGEDKIVKSKLAAEVVMECTDVANFAMFIAERMLDYHVNEIENRFVTQGWWTPDENSRIMMYRDTFTEKIYFESHQKVFEANLPILPDWAKKHV